MVAELLVAAYVFIVSPFCYFANIFLVAKSYCGTAVVAPGELGHSDVLSDLVWRELMEWPRFFLAVTGEFMIHLNVMNRGRLCRICHRSFPLQLFKNSGVQQ